ncbi:hypothetical protein D9M68_324710 [compost metagenome]
MGRRFLGVAQGAPGPDVDADAAVQALVIGRGDLGEHHQAEIDAGDRVALVGVDEIGHLGRALDADVRLVATDFHVGGDGQLAQPVAGVFQHGGAAVAAVRHVPQQGAHVPVGHVLQLGDAGAHLLHAVLVEQVQQVALADLAGAVLGVEIALLVGAGAHVGEHEVDHVLAALALFPQLDRRDAQAFGVDLPGVGVVAGRHRAADVGEVALADGPEDQLALVEHRLVHAAVEDVAALVGRVVVIDHVAFGDVVAEEPGHALHRGNQRAQVDRDVLALQDHLRKMVEQGVGIVMGQVEHTGTAGLFQGQGHLALRCLQRAPDNRKGDRINCFHRSPTFLLVLRVEPPAAARGGKATAGTGWLACRWVYPLLRLGALGGARPRRGQK